MTNLQTIFEKAVRLHQSGFPQEAITLYLQILSTDSMNPYLLFLAGSAFSQIGKHTDGINYLQESARIAPNPITYNNLAGSLVAMHRYTEAIQCLKIAIELDPNYSEGFCNLGIAQRDAGLLEDSLCSLEQATLLTPNYRLAFSEKGITHFRLGDYSQSIECHTKAIKLDPALPESYHMTGLALIRTGRISDAISYFDKAIELRPNFHEAYSDRGGAHKKLGKFDKALADYNKAIEISPDCADFYWNKSLLLLLTGQYQDGWELYESRFENNETKKNYYHFPKLSWRGKENIERKRLFIYSEQGLGDTIQFCRYLPQIKTLGAEIIFEVPNTLTALVSTLDCQLTIIAKGDKQPEFDTYCPVMSLPYVFKTTLETVPNRTPYLFADQEKVKKWEEILGSNERLRVGIAWSGSPTHKNDKNRSIKLELLTSLFALPIEYHSIQKEYRPYDLEALEQTPIVQHQDELDDLSDTAALIECMDLIISVDTSVAHVAGALGKPVWIMLSYVPDYRWMLERDDSPWYPTAKLFRQPNVDDWDSSVHSVYENLQQLVR